MESSGGINLCHSVRGLWFLSPNRRVGWQRDPCGCVSGCLRPLNADSGWRRVNSQTWTPARTKSWTKFSQRPQVNLEQMVKATTNIYLQYEGLIDPFIILLTY